MHTLTKRQIVGWINKSKQAKNLDNLKVIAEIILDEINKREL